MGAYNRYSSAIYRYCYFRVNSRDFADDLTQEAFIKIWEEISWGRKINNIRAFLYKVSRNLIVDFYRKKAKRLKKEKSLDQMLLSRVFPESLIFEQEEEFNEKELSDSVLCALSCLSKNYQDLLLMRYADGMKPKQIAEVFRTNSKNISAKIKRAKIKLGENYGKMSNLQKRTNKISESV